MTDKPFRFSRPIRFLALMVALAFWLLFFMATFQPLGGVTTPVTLSLIAFGLVRLFERKRT